MLRFPLVRNSRWWCQTSSSYISSLMVNIKLIKLKPTVRKKNLSRPTVNNLSQARAPFFHETKSTYRADFLTHFLTTFHFIQIRSFLNHLTVTTNKSRTGATVNSLSIIPTKTRCVSFGFTAKSEQRKCLRIIIFHLRPPVDNLKNIVAWIIPSLAGI